MAPAVIIGGGISGLSTAYYLNKSGVPAVLIEKNSHLGGVIRTEHVEGCVVEGGPDSFLSIKPWALDLIRDLGLTSEVIHSNDATRKTFVWKRGRMTPLPDGLQLMVPTRILPMVTTPLLGWGTKIRMGLEWFRRPSGQVAHDRSVAEFIADHYGQEAVDYLAEPLLAGVYGGDPALLSVSSVLARFVELERRYGSLTKGTLAERRKATGPSAPLFTSLKAGMGQLVEALVKATGAATRTVRGQAEAIERTGRGFRVRVSGEWIDARHAVIATEAHRAAPLLGGMDGAMAEGLASVPYNSSVTVAFAFGADSFAAPPAGFGFLVPKCERERMVACTYVGNKFGHRVSGGAVLVRCFLGGGPIAESDDAIVSGVLDELREKAGARGAPKWWRLYRIPQSMAQYTVGHARRIEETEARAAAVPGLHLAGNAYHGIGVPDCVRMGKQAAEQVRAALDD
ncbi:MAG: protoporphyrinogen oxidase [Bryobacteraceae bacterium]